MFGKNSDENIPNFSFFDEGSLSDGEAISAFINDPLHRSHRNEVHTTYGNYLTCETKDGMQAWCQLDPEDKTNIINFNLHYKTSTRTKIVLSGWTSQTENHLSGLAYVWNKNAGTEFPMNLDVVNAGMFADYEAGEFTAQIAAFGRDVSLYANEEEYIKDEAETSAESFIPSGTFPASNDAAGWKPSAHAILSGKIEHVSKYINSYSGEGYYHLIVSCMGLKLDVPLAAAAAESEPKENGYIHGLFYLTARLFPSDNDEQLTPLFSINTGKIIEDWKSLKFDEDYAEPCEGWELLAYPIMPDKSVLVIFQNTTEADAEDTEKSVYYYRLLHFDKNGQITEQRRARLIGEVLHTAYYDRQAHLHIVYSPIGDETSYVYDADDGAAAHTARPLGEDISILITNSKGNIFVGRNYSSYLEWADDLVTIYGSDAKKITDNIYTGYRCSELVLDDNENVWCYTEPITALYKLTPNRTGNYRYKRENFPLSRVLAIAISHDGNTIFCECECAPNRSRFYLFNRHNGEFGEPKELRLPFVIQEYCELYGLCSTAKNRILFNVDGTLYFYKLESKKCGTLDSLSKTRIKQRSSDEGRFYSVEIDPSTHVDISELDYYVKPIIENMRDLYCESLTVAFNKARASDLVDFIQVTKDGDAYHMELGVAEKGISTPVRIYALLKTDFDTVYSSFKTVIVDGLCPDLSEWVDYTNDVFGNE